jgi:hypothetical protein
MTQLLPMESAKGIAQLAKKKFAGAVLQYDDAAMPLQQKHAAARCRLGAANVRVYSEHTTPHQ